MLDDKMRNILLISIIGVFLSCEKEESICKERVSGKSMSRSDNYYALSINHQEKEVDK